MKSSYLASRFGALAAGATGLGAAAAAAVPAATVLGSSPNPALETGLGLGLTAAALGRCTSKLAGTMLVTALSSCALGSETTVDLPWMTAWGAGLACPGGRLGGGPGGGGRGEGTPVGRGTPGGWGKGGGWPPGGICGPGNGDRRGGGPGGGGRMGG